MARTTASKPRILRLGDAVECQHFPRTIGERMTRKTLLLNQDEVACPDCRRIWRVGEELP